MGTPGSSLMIRHILLGALFALQQGSMGTPGWKPGAANQVADGHKVPRLSAADYVATSRVCPTEGTQTLRPANLGRTHPAVDQAVRPRADFRQVQAWSAAPGFQPGVPIVPCSKVNCPPGEMRPHARLRACK